MARVFEGAALSVAEVNGWRIESTEDYGLADAVLGKCYRFARIEGHGDQRLSTSTVRGSEPPEGGLADAARLSLLAMHSGRGSGPRPDLMTAAIDASAWPGGHDLIVDDSPIDGRLLTWQNGWVVVGSPSLGTSIGVCAEGMAWTKKSSFTLIWSKFAHADDGLAP
jgi:hypothetical protein